MARIDSVLVVGLAACAGGVAFAAPLVTGAATAIVLVGLAVGRPDDGGGPRAVARRRFVAATIAVVGAAAFFVGAVRSMRCLARAEQAREVTSVRGVWPARCALEGNVVSSPVRIGDGMRVDVEAIGTCDHGVARGRTTLHVPSEIAPAMARGDRVAAVAQLAPPYRFWNEGSGDPRPTQARRGVVLSGGAQDVVVRERGVGVRATIDRLRNRIRARIDATFPRDTSGMARALVLGEDDLSAEDQRAFRRSGLAHLLAVSGMHLVLVVAGLVAALRALFVRIPAIAARVDATRVAAAIGLPFTWLYADLAGGSGSAIRAAWMASAGLLACVLARRPVTWRSLGISVLAMWLADPLVGWDVSFLLSAAATAGILALGARMDALAKARLPGWLALLSKPLATTASATLACAPILASMAGDLPLSGLLANVLAVPFGELAALPLCLLHALLEATPLAERGAALAASGALEVVRGIARWFASRSWGSAPVPTPTPGELAAFAVLAFGLTTRRPRTWTAAALATIALLELRARAHGAPRDVLRVTFLDVGQGDAALVDLPDGSALVIDGGGLVGSPVDVGERVLGPVLRARRRRSVGVAILSHPHPDHFGGLRSGLEATQVGALWDTGQGEAEGVTGGYADLLARMRARGVRVERPSMLCGRHTLGGAELEVLAPCPGPSPDDGPNDNSFVVRLRYRERSFLFAGDAERREESALVAAHADLRADVLKVGHHGSRTSSTPAWLDAVAPSVAVVSCGVRNRFGHPHPTTLASLARARARVYRTDRDGGVVVTTDGSSLDVEPAAIGSALW